MSEQTKRIERLYEEHFGRPAVSVEAVPGHASSRILCRLSGPDGTVVGAVFESLEENKAFVEFSRVFYSLGLPVPEILRVTDDYAAYLMSDLGRETLYEVLQRERGDSEEFPESITSLYEQALSLLVRFQVEAAEKLDYSLCYQGDVYGSEAMLGDFCAFEKDYLQRLGIQYSLEDFQADSESLVSYLVQSPPTFFMYRDFQARNIVVGSEGLGFVDYQAGRRGPLQYDVVSLLFQSQARIPTAVREHLLNHYLAELGTVHPVNRDEFKQHFYGYVLMRLYQVLATYGREGLGNRKPYFLNGIPKALGLLKEISEAKGFPVAVPELSRVTSEIVEHSPV